ncbi:uncharacterized protein LOC112599871 isoform X2 [Melanaphis sacchari]|uniref:uncharacterized protein LOC112599871 isoform X2 n=1 Tax=Melanaphis sacchari TaxID=742174 RepID=UPI000DC159DE|nr:uncharacterized protein LOC112599871 isoform X2 [Melanaphis sacchari]
MDKRPEHVRKLPPLASSEDLSEDLLDSPEADAKNKCLEDIEEVPSTPGKASRQQTICLAMPNTPRIDISRASSSSHHDDSSPERDLFVDADGKSVESVKSGLGYTEEIIPDLHSSTEELNFHDLTESEIRRRRSKLQPQYAVSDATMDTDFAADRRDTASESGFLCISGRSSRVSSVGSVHSTASVASAASRLSAASNYSRASRGSSPHRVLLETSFCGPKSPEHFANRQLIPINDDDDDLSEPTVRPKLADIETQTERRPKKVHVESVKKEIKNDQIKAKVKKTTKSKEIKETKEVKEIKLTKEPAMENESKERKTQTKTTSKVKVVLDNPKTQKFVPLDSLDDDDIEIIQGNAPKQVPTAIPRENSSRPKVSTGENQIYIPLNPDPSEQAFINPTSPKRLKPFTNRTLVDFINRDPATIESSKRIRRPIRSGSPGIREEFRKFISSADEEADGTPIQPVKLRKQMSIEMTKRKSIDQDCSSRSMSPSIFEEFQKFISEPEDGDINITKLDTKNRCSAISITSREVQSVVGSGLTDSPNLGRSLSPSIHEEFHKFMAQPDDEEKGIIHKTLPHTAYKNPIEGSPSLSTSSNIRSISPSIYEEFQKFIVEPEGNDDLLPPPPPRKHDNDLHPDEAPCSRSVSPGILDEFQKFISEPDDDLSGRKICDPPPPAKSQQMIKVQVHCTPGSPPPEQIVIKSSGRPKSDDLVKIIPLKSEDDDSGTMDKSKDRRGSSRSLLGSLLQRASSFRSINKKSPKRSSGSEFVDIDPKFTNVEFKFNQDIEKDTVIIPLHSPNDSFDELVVSDSNSNITRAIVHVSYEPKQVEIETASDKKIINDAVTHQNEELIESIDKKNVVDDAVKNIQNIKDDIWDSNASGDCKITNNSVKLEESSLSPGFSRSQDPVNLANSNDTSPDSEVMSSLTIAATEEEKKKLFSHPNSVEEELPHVPTTLPLERSVAVPIIPVKHRIAETKTCSLDRPTPRCSTSSTTDLPSGLGTYAIAAAFEDPPVVTSKIQIILPKNFHKPATTVQTPTTDPPRRRRARSVNAPMSCSRGRHWVDFGNDDDVDDLKSGSETAFKPRSPKKITVLPMSMRPRRRSSSTNADHNRCGCDCHLHGGHDTWPAVTRNRSDTT